MEKLNGRVVSTGATTTTTTKISGGNKMNKLMMVGMNFIAARKEIKTINEFLTRENSFSKAAAMTIAKREERKAAIVAFKENVSKRIGENANLSKLVLSEYGVWVERTIHAKNSSIKEEIKEVVTVIKKEKVAKVYATKEKAVPTAKKGVPTNKAPQNIKGQAKKLDLNLQLFASKKEANDVEKIEERLNCFFGARKAPEQVKATINSSFDIFNSIMDKKNIQNYGTQVQINELGQIAEAGYQFMSPEALLEIVNTEKENLTETISKLKDIKSKEEINFVHPMVKLEDGTEFKEIKRISDNICAAF